MSSIALNTAIGERARVIGWMGYLREKPGRV
jgi:hypothetical protein